VGHAQGKTVPAYQKEVGGMQTSRGKVAGIKMCGNAMW
jgi:hypothetical protein